MMKVKTVVDEKFEDILRGHVVLSRAEIQRAIKDQQWQKLRVSMKGKSTEEKLKMCRDWLRVGFLAEPFKASESGLGYDIAIIQVTNYINALKRGGQLSREGQIQR